tara:strand:+ start:81 stop:806 length:726 start_codon:yes stop_codon:yes gene_type:complete
MDLIISGNITKDTLFYINDNFLKKIKLGGIMNVWWHFQSINKIKYNVHLQPLTYGESIILIDKSLCERHNRSQLNIITDIKHDIIKSKWYHLMYINQLNEYNEEYLSKINSDILSCDTCGGVEKNKFNIKLLKYFDFIFLSKDDIDKDTSINDLKNNIKGFLIIHDSRSYKIINKDMQTPIKIELNKDDILDNINVLGAGDYFVASFIFYMMDKNITCIKEIKKAIFYSIKSINKSLLLNN